MQSTSYRRIEKLFYEEAAKNPDYISLTINWDRDCYEILFKPPKRGNYEIIKVCGNIFLNKK